MGHRPPGPRTATQTTPGTAAPHAANLVRHLSHPPTGGRGQPSSLRSLGMSPDSPGGVGERGGPDGTTCAKCPACNSGCQRPRAGHCCHPPRRRRCQLPAPARRNPQAALFRRLRTSVSAARGATVARCSGCIHGVVWFDRFSDLLRPTQIYR